MKTLKAHLDSILEGTYMPLIKGDFVAQESDVLGDTFQICMSYDGDMHIFSILDFMQGKYKVNDFGHVVNGHKSLYFSLNEKSHAFNKSLYVLAEAIRRDNISRLRFEQKQERTSEQITIAFDWMIANVHKFETLTESSYKRVQDDNDGDPDSAITLVINDDKIEFHTNCGDSFRFRTSCGGGKSLRVRNALIYLAYVSQKLESSSKFS